MSRVGSDPHGNSVTCEYVAWSFIPSFFLTDSFGVYENLHGFSASSSPLVNSNAQSGASGIISTELNVISVSQAGSQM